MLEIIGTIEGQGKYGIITRVGWDMEDRRHFLRRAVEILVTAAAGFIPWFAWLRKAYAQTGNPLRI